MEAFNGVDLLMFVLGKRKQKREMLFNAPADLYNRKLLSDLSVETLLSK